MPYKHGIRNIVASLGTALTLEQIRLLKRYTNNVVMLFDADQAGENATLRSLDLFIEEDVKVKVVKLPGYSPGTSSRSRTTCGVIHPAQSLTRGKAWRSRITQSTPCCCSRQAQLDRRPPVANWLQPGNRV